MLNSITLRPITDADQELLFQIFASTRIEELAMLPWSEIQKTQFLRMQFRAQHTYYLEQFPNAQFDILVRDGNPIGRLYVDRAATEIHVLDIALLPEYRGVGIGSSLVVELIDEARSKQLPLRIYVEAHNPAYRLYSRLGFYKIAETDVYHQLEWSVKNSLS